jgi:hypothetical protein
MQRSKLGLGGGSLLSPFGGRLLCADQLGSTVSQLGLQRNQLGPHHCYRLLAIAEQMFSSEEGRVALGKLGFRRR